MPYHGTVKEGRIELDADADLPEGAQVTVVLDVKPRDDKSWTDLARRFAGSAGGDRPTDLAEQHDHHLQGTPTR